MRISIISPGKFGQSPESAIFSEYVKRTKWKVELKEIDVKSHKSLTPDEIKKTELSQIEKLIKNNQTLIALDCSGKQMTSDEFALKLQDLMNLSKTDLAFVIGGSCGLHKDVYNRCEFSLSFGKMTFPHLIARVLLAEQIYRAYSILNKHPYHK